MVKEIEKYTFFTHSPLINVKKNLIIKKEGVTLRRL